MIFKDIQGAGGEGSSLVGGWYPLTCSLSCVYTKCRYMCSMHEIYMCVHLDGKIGINYVHMRDWQLSEYAIVLNIAHLILKGRMYTTDCFL